MERRGGEGRKGGGGGEEDRERGGEREKRQSKIGFEWTWGNRQKKSNYVYLMSLDTRESQAEEVLRELLRTA